MGGVCPWLFSSNCGLHQGKVRNGAYDCVAWFLLAVVHTGGASCVTERFICDGGLRMTRNRDNGCEAWLLLGVVHTKGLHVLLSLLL